LHSGNLSLLHHHLSGGWCHHLGLHLCSGSGRTLRLVVRRRDVSRAWLGLHLHRIRLPGRCHCPAPTSGRRRHALATAWLGLARNATSCRRRLNTAAAPVALGLPQLQPRLAALPLSFLVTSVADTATTEASLLHRSFFLPSSSCWWYSNSHVHSPIKELARVWDAKTHHANIVPPDQGNPTPHT
jgi:hypothetical protein